MTLGVLRSVRNGTIASAKRQAQSPERETRAQSTAFSQHPPARSRVCCLEEATLLRFMEFTLDLDQRRLWAARGEVRLTPKVFELLKLLLLHRPKALPKHEILSALWPDAFVEESNVSTVIRDLRAALGDDAQSPRYVRTAYGYGYAFIAEVSAHEANARSDGGWRLIHERRQIDLQQGENVLGRFGDDILTIDSPTVSRQHARITVSGDTVLCEDLGSKNGTFVGTARVETATPLQDGDELRLGSVVVIVRRHRDETGTQTIDLPGR